MAILKSGQEFLKNEENTFREKLELGRFGKASVLRKKGGRLDFQVSPVNCPVIGKEWSFSTLVEVFGLFYPWCGLRPLWDSGFGRWSRGSLCELVRDCGARAGDARERNQRKKELASARSFAFPLGPRPPFPAHLGPEVRREPVSRFWAKNFGLRSGHPRGVQRLHPKGLALGKR